MRFSYYVDGDLDFLDDEEEEDESVPSDDRSQEEMKAVPHKRASRIVYSQKTKDMMNSMLQRLLRENPSMSKKDISRAIFDHLREEGIGIGSLRSVQTWVYNNTRMIKRYAKWSVCWTHTLFGRIMNCDSTILAINEFILQTTSFMNEFLQT